PRTMKQFGVSSVDADHCLGRSRGGLTTKIHAVVDAQELPIRLGRTTGQAHDGQIADTLLNQLGPHTIVLADKAYDADRIRQLIQDQGARPTSRPRATGAGNPASASGSTASATSSSPSSPSSSTSAVSPPATTSSPPTFSPWSNSLQCGCGYALMSLRARPS